VSESRSTRHPELLVAPGITLLAVLVLLGVAAAWEQLPIHPPECGFRQAFDIPCVGCGGTRSMRALADGKLLDALALNPAVVLGVATCGLWFGASVRRFRRGDPPRTVEEQNRLIRVILPAIGLVLLADWLYLVLFLE